MNAIVFLNVEALVWPDLRVMVAKMVAGNASEPDLQCSAANDSDSRFVPEDVAEGLSKLIEEFTPSFVITSPTLIVSDRVRVENLLRHIGLAQLADHLHVEWRVEADDGFSRPRQIQSWLNAFSDADIAYVIVDTRAVERQFANTALRVRAVFFDERLRLLRPEMTIANYLLTRQLESLRDA